MVKNIEEKAEVLEKPHWAQKLPVVGMAVAMLDEMDGSPSLSSNPFYYIYQGACLFGLGWGVGYLLY